MAAGERAGWRRFGRNAGQLAGAGGRGSGMLSYAGKIWSCRYFWLSLVLIDLRMRYRRSVLGLGWSLVRPILMTMILCAVFRRLFMRQDVWTFAPYVLAGLACWDYI